VQFLSIFTFSLFLLTLLNAMQSDLDQNYLENRLKVRVFDWDELKSNDYMGANLFFGVVASLQLNFMRDRRLLYRFSHVEALPSGRYLVPTEKLQTLQKQSLWRAPHQVLFGDTRGNRRHCCPI
jgi:hypothetical protein